MHGEKSLGPWGQPALGLGQVDVPGRGVDIRKHGPGPKAHDGPRRGEEAVWGRDDLVPRPDIQGHQGQDQRVRPRGATDRRALGKLQVALDMLLERADLAPQDEGLSLEHALESPPHLVPYLRIGPGQVQNRQTIVHPTISSKFKSA